MPLAMHKSLRSSQWMRCPCCLDILQIHQPFLSLVVKMLTQSSVGMGGEERGRNTYFMTTICQALYTFSYLTLKQSSKVRIICILK